MQRPARRGKDALVRRSTASPLETPSRPARCLGGGYCRSRLQAVEFLYADRRRPRPHFILRKSEARERIVVANTVEGCLNFVVRYPQQQCPSTARHERARRHEHSFLLQTLQVRTMRVDVLQNIFQRFAITNDCERIHNSSRKQAAIAPTATLLPCGMSAETGQ